MNIFISHQSALAVLRAVRSGLGRADDSTAFEKIERFLNTSLHYQGAASVTPDYSEKINKSHVSLARVVMKELLGDVEKEPIHLTIGSCVNRCRSMDVVCHVVKQPEKSFIKICNDVYISTPEALFLQMATCCSLWELIELGYELCGTYSLGKEASADQINAGLNLDRRATTVKHLISYLDRCGSVAGIRKAKTALRFILNNSASPMETAVAMMLFLSQHYGGYGLPLARMNCRVDIPVSCRTYARYRVCDFYWPQYKLALEYDSDTFHKHDVQQGYDSIRRNDLFNSGVTVLSLTTKQFRQLELFDKQVRALEKHIKHRRQSTPTGLRRKAELHRYLTRF